MRPKSTFSISLSPLLSPPHCQPQPLPNSILSSDVVLEAIIIIISGFGIYGAAVVPDSGVGNTWQRLTLVLHEFLSNGLTPSRLHIVISFLTHADHVFLGLPRSLVPGTPNRVIVHLVFSLEVFKNRLLAKFMDRPMWVQGPF